MGSLSQVRTAMSGTTVLFFEHVGSLRNALYYFVWLSYRTNDIRELYVRVLCFPCVIGFRIIGLLIKSLAGLVSGNDRNLSMVVGFA